MLEAGVNLSDLEHFISLGKAVSSSTAVTVVANLKEREPNDVHDVQTEYLNQNELDEITSGFREAGYHTDAFIDEIEFVKWLSAGRWRSSGYRCHAVYSLAQRGTSAGRHAFVPAAASLVGMTLLTSDPYFDCLCHHKFHASTLLQSAGLNVPRTWLFDARTGWANSREPDAGLRVIAKPNFESASVGVEKDSVFDFGGDEVLRLSKLAEALQQSILVQEFISGWEIEVPVLSGKDAFALDPIGVSFGPSLQMGDRIVDHSAAYEGAYHLFDFGKSEPQHSEALRRSAAHAAVVLGVAGIARIDFRMSSSGKAYIMDMTGQPHLSRQSSVAVSFAMLGFGYSDIFSAMVGIAASRG